MNLKHTARNYTEKKRKTNETLTIPGTPRIVGVVNDEHLFPLEFLYDEIASKVWAEI